MKCLLLLLFLFPSEPSAGLVEWSKARKNVDYGQGPIVDDIESYVPNDRFAKQMRNRKDVGEWVHEQTHNVNAQFGIIMKKRTKKHGWTSAYVLGGRAFSALQPDIKLTDVKAEIGKDPMDLIHTKAIKAWNDWPLYVLDEASASANALAYEVSIKAPSSGRTKLAVEWARISEALIVAIEKGDPDYEDLDRLRGFIKWHNARIRSLANLPKPQPTYKLY